MDKQFMVVELHKDEQFSDAWLNDATTFTNFDSAFDYFNEKASVELPQIKQPKSAQPLRASLSDRFLELWVISRTAEFVKI